jgi:MASE11
MNIKKIKALFELPGQIDKSEIAYFRHWLLHYLLLGLALFGFIAYLPRLVMNQGISFVNKSLGLLAVFYILGLGLLIFLGPNGAGFLWLLMFSIMTGVLLGVRPALISLGINFISLLALSLFVHSQALPWQQLKFDP